MDETEMYLQELSDEFDQRVQERHRMGAEKYGEGSFVNVDTLEMALHEILDLANYARYTFIRLRLMQEELKKHFEVDGTVEKPLPGKENLGDIPPGVGFISTSRKE